MTSAVAPTWNAPRPNTALRNTHKREGWSSSPMMNSSRTTPRSAKSMVPSTSVTSRRPQGPITSPAARNPSTAPSLSRLNSGTRTTAAARKTKASVSSVTRYAMPMLPCAPWPTAAITRISTLYFGFASFDSTQARAGVWPSGIQASQTTLSAL